MKKPLFHWILTALIAAAASTAAYFIGRNQTVHDNDDLLAELETLRAEQSDAAVVKRVSQQMEDIAYMQKTVSDQERDRAEQQSKLALEMRDRAEQETRLAHDAEIKAKEAAEEAEEERARALTHQIMAEEQRDAANHAKSVSDTLNYRAIGRTLGNSSVTQFESGNTAIAGKLAYASWYLMNKYKGNTYQPETFNSLSMCSATQASIQTLQRGTVRAFHPLYGVGCVTVTDYGEIEIHRTSGTRRSVVLQNSAYDFRDVWADDSNIYALSLHGPLCHTDYSHLIREIALPEGIYTKLLRMSSGNFLVAASRHILELDIRTGSIIGRKDLSRELSTLVSDDQSIILFFTDGTASRLGTDLSLTDIDITKGKTVTSAYYDGKLTALFAGYDDGSIGIFNRKNECLATILGHTGRITDIVTVGGIMVSSSYDNNVCVWNLPIFKFEGGRNLAEGLGVSEESLGLEEDITAMEIPSPVTIEFQSWPFALAQFSPTDVIAGTANGEVHRFNVSTDRMASILRENSDVTMSESEWELYIGSSVQYINMK